VSREKKKGGRGEKEKRIRKTLRASTKRRKFSAYLAGSCRGKKKGRAANVRVTVKRRKKRGKKGDSNVSEGSDAMRGEGKRLLGDSASVTEAQRGKKKKKREGEGNLKRTNLRKTEKKRKREGAILLSLI